MRKGNFSPAEMAKEGNITASGSRARPAQCHGAGPVSRAESSRRRAIDPNMQALMKLYPLPNADPNANGGYNWVDDLHFNQNNTQWMSRVDYSISDNTKMFVRYNLQREVQLFPIGLWSSATTQQLPYPTPDSGQEPVRLGHGIADARVQSVDDERVRLRLHVHRLPERVPGSLEGGSHEGRLQLQGPVQERRGADSRTSTGARRSGAASALRAALKSAVRRAGCTRTSTCPASATTLSKIWGKHTLKAGVFWENIRNAQPANNTTNGQLSVNVGNSNSLGNPYADMLVGNLNSYTETSFNRINDISYNTTKASCRIPGR